MKILHTADWHLGKLLSGVYLHEDQAFILEELRKLLMVEKPDLILMAGDVYDRSYPPVEAVRLLNKIIETIIIELNIKMVIISGNHDHSDRLDFGSSLMEKSGLYLRAKLEPEIKPITFADAYGEWDIYAIPYADPALVREVYKEDSIKTASEAMRTIIQPISDRIQHEKEEAIKNGRQPKRYIAVAHAFFIGERNGEQQIPEESDSERVLSVGGVDYIPADCMDAFDYVALGHLHKVQTVARETMRYSGSLLKYSFSEANHQKSMVILDWEEKLQIRLVELTPKRDLRVIQGNFKEILENARQDKQKEDYILVRLTDSEVLLDPMNELKAVYPNALALEYEKREVLTDKLPSRAGQDFSKKDIWTLFEEFYESVSGEKPELEALKKIEIHGGDSGNEAD